MISLTYSAHFTPTEYIILIKNLDNSVYTIDCIIIDPFKKEILIDFYWSNFTVDELHARIECIFPPFGYSS